MDLKQSSPSVTDSALRLPSDVPDLPVEVIERFPSMRGWIDEQKHWWRQAQNALQDFARATLDVTEIAGILIVDPNISAIYIKRSRGDGAWASPDTGFYVDSQSFFSLGSSLTWNPIEQELIVDGTIIATSGTIGGFDLGPDYIRDTANSFGLASTVTGGDDVRFWAGDTFANRATAPVRIRESGIIEVADITTGNYIKMSNSGLQVGGDATKGQFFVLNNAGSGQATIKYNGTTVGTWSTGATYSILTVQQSGTGGATIDGRNGYSFLTTNVGTALLSVAGPTSSLVFQDAGAFTLTGAAFTGNGSGLTTLNATNISSGTLANARLPSTISVTSLTASGEIRGATARFGTHSALGLETVTGFVTITDDGGAARKLAVLS